MMRPGCRFAGWAMRFNIAAKILAIALALMALMAIVVAVGLRLFGQVTNQLDDVVHDYLPIYGAVAQANEDSLMQGVTVRRIIIDDLRGRQDQATIERNRKALHDYST